MRVLVVTHAGGSPHHGQNMRWYFLGQALAPLDVEVEIASASYFHKYVTPPAVTDSYQSEEIDGLRYHWVRTPRYTGSGVRRLLNQGAYVAGLYRHARVLAARQPDVVIASSPPPFMVWAAHAIARRAGARFLFEGRDLWPQILLELGGLSAGNPYIRLTKRAERFGVTHAERVLSVKPGDGEYYAAEYGLPLERFAYIPNGFLPGAVDNPAPEALVSLSARYRHLVGYVGALSSWYGLEHLVAAAARLQTREDIGFVIVGGGELETALRAQAGSLKNVHLVGPVPRASVPACLELFTLCYAGMNDMGINRYGISSNKVFEYMHAGKAIIACWDIGHDPVSAADCGVSVKPGEHAALAGAIETLLDDDARRYGNGRRAREHFDAYHNFSVVARKLVDEVLQ